MDSFIKFILSLIEMFANKPQQAPADPIEVKLDVPELQKQALNWDDPKSMVSEHFTVSEMLYLPTWKRMANPADGLDDEIKANLLDLAKSMDIVRNYFGKPIRVHVTYRPKEYNRAIGGALDSAHFHGQAMDFDIEGVSCDEVRKQIVDNKLLDTWAMRCEDAPGTNWVHLDRRTPAIEGHRFFKP